jgi:hypothetical protein
MTDVLRRVSDLLLPGGEDVELDAALVADPRIDVAARRGLRALAAHVDDLERGLAELATTDPQAYGALLLVVSAAHYADARVRDAIGYEGPRALPLPGGEPDADLEPLLARVRARGPRYREIPSS